MNEEETKELGSILGDRFSTIDEKFERVMKWIKENKSSKCPICGSTLFIDIQQTRLRKAWIQYPIRPKIPQSISLMRVNLLFKLWNVEECY